jgi:hypothetical protein
VKVNNFDFWTGQFINVSKVSKEISFEILIMKRLLRLVKLSYLAELLGRLFCVKNERANAKEKFRQKPETANGGVDVGRNRIRAT